MKNLLFLAIVFIIVQTEYSQTIKLGGVEISIGDSLSKVTSKIDTNYYNFTLTKPEKMEQMGFLSSKDYPERQNSPISFLGIIFFFVPNDQLNLSEQPTVTCVQKIWAHGTSNAIDIMEKFYALLDNYGIDKYDNNIDYKKEVEPDNTSYTIVIETNSWHTIEFAFDKNGVQLSEIFTENEHQFDDKIYYLIFDDYKHYSNKKDNIIIEKFEDEKKAEERKRMLEIPYIAQFNTLAKCEIIRVWRSRFNKN